MLGLTDIATEAVFSTATPLVHTKASDENEMKVNWANLSLIRTILHYTALFN